MQVLCEEYLDVRGVKYIRVPDQVYRQAFGFGSCASMRVRGQISSYLLGLPDLTILFPSRRYWCVELKRPGGKLRQGQKIWSYGMKNYVVIDNFNDFISLVSKELGNETT
ncbi:MAG: hypothetical protein ABIK28_02750 [Planctomycetota bacterium]